ncbi:bacteriocin immunity protein [Streptococcus sciuri]|uniref:Bacteriocin immunity protein n=1 Tax=Streptococcus sciuri TaxID=2973939 RepID=A0ABT2FA23_9STRE|nr:bacteriocin immunity protein [Streptococcus sciuri]MCS4488682.1 bacteriocin immunity protein [Streptococcus sciuri]
MTEKEFTEELVDIILSDISMEERNIIIEAKNNIENNEFFYKIIFNLKLRLGFLGIKGKLSPVTSEFYAKLLHDFPGREWGVPIRKLPKDNK